MSDINSAVAMRPVAVATPYQLIGGEAGVRRLANAFYELMAEEPAFWALRAIHAPDLSPMRERLSAWLIVWMGGPRPASGERTPCIMTAHAGLPINGTQARLWMTCMRRAFARAQVPAEVVEMVEPPFALMCEGLRNDYGSDQPLMPENAV